MTGNGELVTENRYGCREDSQFNSRRAAAAGARAQRPDVPAEVPAQHGANGEPEEDPRPAQGHRAREDDRAPAPARTRERSDGEEIAYAADDYYREDFPAQDADWVREVRRHEQDHRGGSHAPEIAP